ncbi:MAG: MFS transporter [Clostridia bacterium]|nr:MFS transporter [Clostridia bacterium]
MTQATINNLAPLLFVIFHESLKVDLSRITLLVTANFLIQLAVDALCPYVAEKIGYRKCIVASHIFSASGLIMMGILPLFMPPFPALLISVGAYAVGGGIIEVLISPITEGCPTENKTSAMSLLHSFYCWGIICVVILSTAFLYFFGKESWNILCVLWSLLPIFNAVLFIRVPINELEGNKGSKGLFELFKNPAFLPFILLMVTAGASEQAMSQWASFFVESSLKLPKALGDLLGICTFALFMGIARVLFSAFGEKVKINYALAVSGIINLLSYIIAALSPYAFVSLIACAVCGLSSGILWPGVFSMVSSYFPRGGTLIFAILALAGDLGCSAGPTLTGFVSTLFNDNLHIGLLSAVIFPLTLIISALTLKKRQS